MKKVLIEEPFRVSVKRDAQIPTPKEGEALLQVMYCGICGADLASYTGNQPFTTSSPSRWRDMGLIRSPANYP